MPEIYDIIIIGAGASGMFTAYELTQKIRTLMCL